MTVCNMSIEGGARVGYVNPDRTTFEYLRGRRFAPTDSDFERAVEWWSSQASESGADYDDVVEFDGSAIEPMVTWGTNPGQVVGVDQAVPDPRSVHPAESDAVASALDFMGLEPGQPIAGFEWRDAGCSMCLGMNPDKLEGRQVSASSSNRNFIGRQGSPTGRTLLMSPAMVAAAALAGSVADVRGVAR